MADEAQKDSITLFIDGVKADAHERGLTKGPNAPKVDLFIREMESAMRVRAAASPEFYKSITDLVLYRKDAAKKMTDNILDIGKKAAEGEVSALTGLDTAKAQTVGLATATNIETQGIVQKSRAGWSAFWGNVADFFQDIPGCDFITNFCRERETRYAPKVIEADVSQFDKTKGTIGVDPRSPVGRAMGVFQTSLLSLDNNTAGLNGQTFSGAHSQVDKAKQAVADGSPPVVAPVAGPVLPAASAASASVGSIETFAKQVLDKVAKDVKLDADKIDKLTKQIVIADTIRGGNKDGKIDGNEGTNFHQSEAYKGLSGSEKQILDKHLGISADGKVLAPVAAGPAPVLN